MNGGLSSLLNYCIQLKTFFSQNLLVTANRQMTEKSPVAFSDSYVINLVFSHTNKNVLYVYL